jgi:hypothetical protein
MSTECNVNGYGAKWCAPSGGTVEIDTTQQKHNNGTKSFKVHGRTSYMVEEDGHLD